MADTRERLDPAVLKLAGILMAGVLAPLFDTTIVNVAIHVLGSDLHASVSDIQWVTTGYLLALAMVIPVAGWAVERFGGKRMWMLSLVLFLVGSVLSSAAWNVGSLIVFRVLQGVGGGLIIPIMQTLIVQAAGTRKLGRVMAVVGLPAMIGPILGPVLGGLIIDNLDWRWIFYVNIPICVLALVLAWRGLPAMPAQGRKSLDVFGLVLLSPALAAIIFGLSQVGVHGGFASAEVIVPGVVGVVLLAAFVVHALRRAEAIVDLRLFRVRSFSAASAVLFLFGLSLYGAMLLLPLYYQQIRGVDALHAGLLLAPQGLGMLLSRGWVGALTDRLGARSVVLAGTAVASVGTIVFTQADAHTNQWLLAASLVVRGAGLGAVTVPIMAAAYQGLSREQVPHATSATRIVQQIGGSFGTAVLAVMLQRLAAGGPVSGFQHTFWWALGFTALALVPAALLPAAGSGTTPEVHTGVGAPRPPGLGAIGQVRDAE